MKFPKYSGLRCLMMPFVQGDPKSLPCEYRSYSDVISDNYLSKGDIGYLTIDESPVKKGSAHRATRSRHKRALHTEVGRDCNWGSPPIWGGNPNVVLDEDTQVLLANNLDDSCAIWDATHRDTGPDGDIGYAADQYPYSEATLMKAGEVYKIGVFTPHESLPVKEDANRQFLRIVGSGVHGREAYFTENPLL